MVDPFERFFPEIQRQKSRFKKVFGEKVAGDIEREAERFRSSRSRSRDSRKAQELAEQKRREETARQETERQEREEQLRREKEESERIRLRQQEALEKTVPEIRQQRSRFGGVFGEDLSSRFQREAFIFGTSRDLETPGQPPDVPRRERAEIQPFRAGDFGAPVSIGFGEAALLSLDIARGKVAGTFFGREREEREIFSPFGKVREARVGQLTEKQLEILKKEDIGTPFVDVSVVRAFEPGITTEELRGRVREEVTGTSQPFPVRAQELSTNIQKELLPGFKSRQEQEFSRLQEQVNLGLITVPKAQGELDFSTKELEKQFGAQAEERFGRELKGLRAQEKEFEKQARVIRTPGEEFETGIPLAIELSALIAGGATTAGLIGTKELVVGGEEQDVTRVLTGAGLVGLGAAGKIAGTQREIIALERAREAQQTELKFIDLELKTGKTGVGRAIIGGESPSGKLSQRAIVDFKLESGKKGTFIRPTGEGRATSIFEPSFDPAPVKGFQDFPFGLKQGAPPPGKILETQLFEVSSKGVSFPLDESGRFVGSLSKEVFIPKIRSQAIFTGRESPASIQKQFKKNILTGGRPETGLFGTRGVRIGEDLFFLETGEATKLGFKTSKEGIPVLRAVEIEKTAGGLTKTFDASRFGVVDTFEITGKGSPRTLSFVTDIPKRGVGVVQKGLSAQAPIPPPQGIKGASGIVSGTRFRQDVFQRPVQGVFEETLFIGEQKRLFPQSQLEIPKIKTDISSRRILGLSPISKESQKFLGIPSTSFKQPIIQKEFTKTGLKREGLISSMAIEKPLSRIADTPFRPKSSPFRGFGIFAFPPIIPIPSGIPRFPRGRGKIPKRRLTRTPSFAAAQLGIEAPAPLELEFTGLVERPLIRKRRKKKR